MTVFNSSSSGAHPPKIAVLVLPGTTLSSIAAAVDIFGVAGVMWNKIMGEPQSPVFDVKLLSPDGNPVPCMGIPEIAVHGSMQAGSDADLIIISALLQNDYAAPCLPKVVNWLLAQHERGGAIASLCTSTFVLAATGLLDGKTATTHWGVAQKLQRAYPRVCVTPHRLITEEGTLFTSGGTHGAMDLCLHLVERFSSRDIALQCAKVMVRDFDSRSQSPYAVFQRQCHHGDAEIARVQNFLDQTYRDNYSVHEMAQQAGLGKRTFERRFKSATGTSPRAYVQHMRIEAAKRMLETGNKTLEQITESVGYGDPSAFSRLFTKLCGVSPCAYRKKFTPILLP